MPAETQAAALKFLKSKHATIANYWIDEKRSCLADKFDNGGPPVVFVFDRQGKRAAKFDTNDPDQATLNPPTSRSWSSNCSRRREVRTLRVSRRSEK